MKTLTFVESVTIYPDGHLPLDVRAGTVLELTDDYAELMVIKGHATEEAAPVPASAKEESSL